MNNVASTAPVDLVSGESLMATCRLMAERQKLSGSADELASMVALQGVLDGFGYRTRLISHDAYISLPGTASVVVDGVALAAITHSFSVPSPAGGLSAPVVYVGDGGAAGFAGKDVQGCIVLAEGIASPAVADRTRLGGAVGQLHISPHEYLHEMCISPVWGSPGVSTLAGLPVTVACTVSHADGSALRDRFAAGETPAVVLHAAVDTGWRPTPILEATLGDEDAPFVLFSGHHDTWYFGVMDNGSANATMVECARVLATQQGAWRRGLRLCFWSGHSHGRYSGSSWYVDNYWDALERLCAVHVNVDSTGGVGATVLHEAAAAPELRAVAAEAIAAETNEALEGKRNARNSDMSFWGVGIPSMLGSLSHQPPSDVKMRNALGWWWHTPHDLLDKIDEANLVRDTRVFVRVLWRLLTAPVLPLDYAAHVSDLLVVLGGMGSALPLDAVVVEAKAVRDKAAALMASDIAPERVNRALMQVSRALVPMDNTLGDRFVHDPALPLSAWPVLDPIRALTKAGDDAKFAMVDAVRARNRVVHALRQAGRALDAALG
jgi:hypothetical protein